MCEVSAFNSNPHMTPKKIMRIEEKKTKKNHTKKMTKKMRIEKNEEKSNKQKQQQQRSMKENGFKNPEKGFEENGFHKKRRKNNQTTTTENAIKRFEESGEEALERDKSNHQNHLHTRKDGAGAGGRNVVVFASSLKATYHPL